MIIQINQISLTKIAVLFTNKVTILVFLQDKYTIHTKLPYILHNEYLLNACPVDTSLRGINHF